MITTTKTCGYGTEATRRCYKKTTTAGRHGRTEKSLLQKEGAVTLAMFFFVFNIYILAVCAPAVFW
jgi:hypothetical protein